MTPSPYLKGKKESRTVYITFTEYSVIYPVNYSYYNPNTLIFSLLPQVKQLFISILWVQISSSADINVQKWTQRHQLSGSCHLFCQFHSSSSEQIRIKQHRPIKDKWEHRDLIVFCFITIIISSFGAKAFDTLSLEKKYV